MKAQFKYALLRELPLRATALGGLILLNLVFGTLGYLGVLGNAAMITGVTLSGIALCGVFVVIAIADTGNFKGIFANPEGYLSALTPVKSWKILLANSVVMIVYDLILFFVGVFGVVWQAMVLEGAIGAHMDYSNLQAGNIPHIIFGFAIILIGYTYIMMFMIFGSALKNSVFFGVRGKTVLSVLSVAAVVWVFNLLNFVLAPFGTVSNWRMFYYIGMDYSFHAGTVVWFLLMSAKIAALFIASSILLERKNNL